MNCRILISLIPMVVLACVTPRAARIDPEGVERAVTAAADRWVVAWERSDAAGVASSFEVDGVYAANTGEVLSGRLEIEEGVRRWIARRPAGIELDLQREPVRFRFDGNSAHDLSRFVIRAMPAGCIVDTGHALAVWRAGDDGAWRIETLLVNRDRVPPDGACDPEWR